MGGGGIHREGWLVRVRARTVRGRGDWAGSNVVLVAGLFTARSFGGRGWVHWFKNGGVRGGPVHQSPGPRGVRGGPASRADVRLGGFGGRSAPVGTLFFGPGSGFLIPGNFSCSVSLTRRAGGGRC